MFGAMNMAPLPWDGRRRKRDVREGEGGGGGELSDFRITIKNSLLKLQSTEEERAVNPSYLSSDVDRVL